MNSRGMSRTRKAMEEYFDLLEEPLSKRAVRAVLEEGKKPTEVMKGMYRSDIMAAGQTLLGSMPYFWRYKDAGRAVADELKDLTMAKRALVAYYQGSVTPAEGPRFVRRALLYADMVVMMDPVSRTALVRHIYSPKAAAEVAVWKALEVLKFRDLCLGAGGRGSPPLVILPPLDILMDEEEFEAIRRLADEHTLEASSEIFGRGFRSLKELSEFIKSAQGPDKLAGRARRTELLEFPDGGLDAIAHLRMFMEEELKLAPEGAFRGPDDPELLKEAYLAVVRGCLCGVNEQFWFCGRFGAQPSTDSEYHWRYLLWAYEHDQARPARALLGEVHKGLRALSSRHARVLWLINRPEFRWLGDVPVKKLVKMREEGALEELRRELGRVFSVVGHLPLEELEEVVDDCRRELEDELRRHEEKLRDLKMEFGLSASAVVVGVLGAALPFLAPLAFLLGGSIGALPALAAAKAGLDWWRERNRPIGILLKPWRAHKAREKGLR